ncbi:hypothetical protein OTU49_005745, partial [Cherax quadricarinatus]
GQVGGGGSYAELPLDADAFRRLESVLESEEAREILGEPLLNMVTNPEQLGTLEELMDSSLFEGEPEDAPLAGNNIYTPSGGTPLKTPPKRRSQRQMDKAEREEVEKILAENQKKLQEERQQLDENQLLTKMKKVSVGLISKGVKEEEDQESDETAAEDLEEKCTVSENENEKDHPSALKAKNKGRSRGRGRGKVEAEKDDPQEMKGKQRGRKNIEDPEHMAAEGRGRGIMKEDTAIVKGRGRGRVRTVICKEGNKDVIKNMEIKKDKNNPHCLASTGIKIKELKVSVKKMNLEQTLDIKVSSPGNEEDSTVNKEQCTTNSIVSETENVKLEETQVNQEPETPVDVSKKKNKKPPVTPKIIPQFEPALFSTPDVMLKVGEVHPPQTIMVKGNGKPVKSRKILLVEKQIKKETGQTTVISKENEQNSAKKQECEESRQAVVHEKNEKLNSSTKVIDKNKLKSDATGTEENDISKKSEADSKDGNQQISSKEICEEPFPDVKVSSFVEKRELSSEIKPKVIQVKSPMDVRQVVVLNSAKAGMYRETLVKVIPPKDPPREEEKISPAKQRLLLKKELHLQKLKIEPQKTVSANKTESVNENTVSFKAEKHRQASIQSKTERLQLQKGGNPLKSCEESFLNRKKEETHRKMEEIQQRREEILRKREAIKKRKDIQKKQNIQQKNSEALDKKVDKDSVRKDRASQNNEHFASRNREIIKKKSNIIADNLGKVQATHKLNSPVLSSPEKSILRQKIKTRQGIHKINSTMPKSPAEKSTPKRNIKGTNTIHKVMSPVPKSSAEKSLVRQSIKGTEAINKINPPLPNIHVEDSPLRLGTKSTQSVQKINSPVFKFPTEESPVKQSITGMQAVQKMKLPGSNTPVEELPARRDTKSIQAVQKVNPPTSKSTEETMRRRSTGGAQTAQKISTPLLNLQAEESPVRRSNRAIKKKTFGDEMLTYDLKEDLVQDAEEEQEPEEEFESEDEEDEESLEDYGEDDDPERLWCICQKPHNNRFMICCDKCEDWFHGSCVGVTKAMGQQMEEDGQEWVCPKCKKAERAMKGFVPPSKNLIDLTPTHVPENFSTEDELPDVLVESFSKTVSQRGNRCITVDDETVPKKIVDRDKEVDVQHTRQPVTRRSNIQRQIHITPVKSLDGKKVDVSRLIPLSPQKSTADVGNECVVESCNKAPKADSIYCSNDCVLKHAQMSLKMLGKTDKVEQVQNVVDAVNALEKSEPRVLVYQKNTAKILTGGEAPTLGQLKEWLKDHPDFAALQPGMMGTSGPVISTNIQHSTTNFYGQKKVIRLSPKSVTVPGGVTPGQKVTVVKSADGRIIVKTTETLKQDSVNKAVTTVSTPTATKSVVVSTTKPVVSPTASAAIVTKEGEGKKDITVISKKDEISPAKSTPAKDNKK